MHKITFYFDLLSPFSYFAWINHTQIKLPAPYQFEYKPVLMGRLFSHFEFRGPGDIPVKRKYELKKCFRYASKNNIAFMPPKVFPFNPLAIDRCGTKSAAGARQFQVIDCLFKAIWQQSLVLEDPELISEILQQHNLADVLELSFAREAKLEIKQNTQEAIDKEIFGVPSFWVEDELFWGNDSLEDLVNYLAGHDNWNRDYYNELVDA